MARWNLTDPEGAGEGAAWLRKESGALMVLLVRPDRRHRWALDPSVSPARAIDLLRETLEWLVDEVSIDLWEAERRKAAAAGTTKRKKRVKENANGCASVGDGV